MSEVKLAKTHLNPIGRIEVTCPYCGWMAPRTWTYIHTLHYTLKCSHCWRIYRVPFAGDKKGKK
jgi:DNA-directed RNA polymerase subunit RPC12/RpoP